MSKGKILDPTARDGRDRHGGFFSPETERIARSAIMLLLPLTILGFGVIWLIYSSQAEAEKQVMKRAASAEVRAFGESLTTELSEMLGDIRLLASYPDAALFVDAPRPENRNRLDSIFKDFLTAKRVYEKARFIYTNGMEVVRVNFANDEATSVPLSQLQNKSHRYYFREGLLLEQGEVYVSALDLNMEYGRIERPFKPVIRIGTPVFDSQGQKQGFIFLNYLSVRLFNDLNLQDQSTKGSILLLDSQGYYLRGLRPENEWGFMFQDERKKRKFSADYLPEWSEISQRPLGQIDNERGIFTFRHIHFPAETDRKNIPFQRDWFLMTFISPADLREVLVPLRYTAWMSAGLVFLILAVFSWLFTLIRVHRQAAQAEYRESEARQCAVLNTLADGLITFDLQGLIQTFNPAAERLFRCDAEEALGQSIGMLFPGPNNGGHGGDIPPYLMPEGDPVSNDWREFEGRRMDGGIFPAEIAVSEIRDNTRRLFSVIVRDITKRRQAETRIEHLAYYDELTGLPNRRLFLNRLKKEFAANLRHGKQGALLYLDLDNFKTINDALGHSVGDTLLQQVGERLSGCIRAEDTVARLGGDEFVVLLTQLSDKPEKAAGHASLVAEKLRGILADPYEFKSREYYTSSSIGIALFPGRADDTVDDVLKRADTAMYLSKSEGRNTFRFYHSSIQATVDVRLALEEDLRHALERGEFTLHYQPQVVVATGHLIGAEALLRWTHPERGAVSPAEFIPAAERTGLILSIGQWVLLEACRRFVSWIEGGVFTPAGSIAVNVSPQQFHQADFVPQVQWVLDKTGIPPACLKLEITESLVMKNVEETIEKMHALKELGLHFSVDDFGTGYSSLAYLTRLPLDVLKIDKSFVQNIAADSGSAAIVETIVSMARHLNLDVIAEGVETEKERHFLYQQGCWAYQGYLFSPPVPAEEFTRLVREKSLEAAKCGDQQPLAACD